MVRMCWWARVRPCSSKLRWSWRVTRSVSLAWRCRQTCLWRGPETGRQRRQRLCDVFLLASSAQTGPTFTRCGVCGHAGPRFRDVTRRLLQCHSRGGIQVYHRQAPASYECRCSRRHRHAEVRSRTHQSAPRRTALARRSRAGATCATVHRCLQHKAPHYMEDCCILTTDTCPSSTPVVRRLPSAACTATPPFHVRSSGLLCGRTGGLELVTRLPSRSDSFCWQFSSRSENFFSRSNSVLQCIGGLAIMRYIIYYWHWHWHWLMSTWRVTTFTVELESDYIRMGDSRRPTLAIA